MSAKNLTLPIPTEALDAYDRAHEAWLASPVGTVEGHALMQEMLNAAHRLAMAVSFAAEKQRARKQKYATRFVQEQPAEVVAASAELAASLGGQDS